MNKINDESFGNYLKRLRESRGLSLRETARAAGVSSGYLSQVEGETRGKRQKGQQQFAPHPQILKKLADTYHVSSVDLFDRAGYFEAGDQYQGFSEEKETDRCFDFVIHDPVLKTIFTVEDKKAVISRYEELTGRHLIKWAGDKAISANKSHFTGLTLQHGALHAKTIHVTLSLAEAARELDTTVENIRRLIDQKHLRPANSRAGEDVLITKEEMQSFKRGLMQIGLKAKTSFFGY